MCVHACSVTQTFKSRYEIDKGKAVCKGASGVVCFGMDRLSKNQVALKFFANKTEFEAELKNCSACNSIYIVKVLDMCIAEEMIPEPLTDSSTTGPAAPLPTPGEPVLISDTNTVTTEVESPEQNVDDKADVKEEPSEDAPPSVEKSKEESVDADGEATGEATEAASKELKESAKIQDAAAASEVAKPAQETTPAVIEKRAAVIDDFCCLVLERGEYNLQEYAKKAGRRLDAVKKKGVLNDIFNGISSMHLSADFLRAKLKFVEDCVYQGTKGLVTDTLLKEYIDEFERGKNKTSL
ncbi:hypothetical protein CYMTET_38159 [Cymbomonas tetramitiformis]|uniref:Uncharacterized protein n=1 Tax=Cymbomonas tetramitiformis TaxID=36881 RepID=A0AAE0F577_9CHLO|nr:hypothetical protein CYMTET_38159 [Cymbomonas tetramitiformis]